MHRFFLILVLLLTACANQTALPPTPTSPVSTLTPTPNETRIPAHTAMPTLQPSPTLDPSPTQTLPPTLTPIPAPLSKSGPWLLFTWGTMYTGPTPVFNVMLSNADGSAWEPLALPAVAGYTADNPPWWMGSIAPTGGYLALQGYENEYYGECRDTKAIKAFDPSWDLAYFIKLPENKVMNSARLLGEAAYEQINKEDCARSEEYSDEVPPVMAVTENYRSFEWSPDARYVAFPAAPTGPAADLYVYDTQTNAIRRLTHRQNNPDILGWSPDGQWIIYRAVKKFYWFHAKVEETTGLYAASMTGEDRLLLSPEKAQNVPTGVEWLSNTEFVFNDGPCGLIASWEGMSCPTQVHMVDLKRKLVKTIYQNEKDWISLLTDPTYHLVLLTIQEKNAENQSLTSRGIYQYDFDSGGVVPVFEGNYRFSYHQGDIVDKQSGCYFIDKQEGSSEVYTDLLLCYTPEGGFSTKPGIANKHRSPDGNWYVDQVGGASFIFDKMDHPVKKIEVSCSGWWSPDSGTYACLSTIEEQAKNNGVANLYLFQKSRNWEPVLARQTSQGRYWWIRWVNP